MDQGFAAINFVSDLTPGVDNQIITLMFQTDAGVLANFGLDAIPTWNDINPIGGLISIDPASSYELGTSVLINAVPIPGAFLLLG